jgi:subtilisin family serine protease
MSFVFFSFSNVAITAEQSQHKIVIFKDGVNDSKTSEIIAKVGGSIKKPLPLIHGKAIVLPTKAAEKALKKYPEVLRIDEDIEITITKAPATSVQPAQSLPWGVDLIDAELAWVSSTGQAVKVAIIDTGVDRNHPDLSANIKGGINTINSAKTYQDDNGHGTHVAGIIGAVNNSIGVVGTAPQVDIYSVKALGRSGSGYLSDIIEGLQWAVTNKMQVISMSLGTNSDNQSFHDAIRAVYNAGIIQVAAAGNDGPTDNSVDFPAKYPETIAVSAIDNLGQIPSWSSRGAEVDLAAPGVDINSTWNNDLYKVISGTSMATPHVTGTVALTIAAKGQMAPDAMKKYLKSKAKNLGLPTNLQGAALVDALASVQ